MRHIWTEPKSAYRAAFGLREYRCKQCGEVVKITSIRARNEFGKIVTQYPLAMDGCMGPVDAVTPNRLRSERTI